jgi:hypothetical protein
MCPQCSTILSNSPHTDLTSLHETYFRRIARRQPPKPFRYGMLVSILPVVNVTCESLHQKVVLFLTTVVRFFYTGLRAVDDFYLAHSRYPGAGEEWKSDSLEVLQFGVALSEKLG